MNMNPAAMRRSASAFGSQAAMNESGNFIAFLMQTNVRMVAVTARWTRRPRKSAPALPLHRPAP